MKLEEQVRDLACTAVADLTMVANACYADLTQVILILDGIMILVELFHQGTPVRIGGGKK